MSNAKYSGILKRDVFWDSQMRSILGYVKCEVFWDMSNAKYSGIIKCKVFWESQMRSILG